MSCYHPIDAWRTSTGVVFHQLARHGDILHEIKLPCGMCIGCRERRARDWKLRILHEAQMHDAACFVTLTYSPGNLPANSSLEHRDFQKFLKRARKNTKLKLRYYMCGEYGETTKRPHYHACLFGINFIKDRQYIGKSNSGAKMYQSPELDKLWQLGIATVQDLTPETAGYCARYIFKKQLGPNADYSITTADGEIIPIKPEYNAMSLKPGIAAEWYARYSSDVHTHDYVINQGAKQTVPKYYDRLLKRDQAERLDDLKAARELKASAHIHEQTPARRHARETVQRAKQSTLKRSLDL